MRTKILTGCVAAGLVFSAAVASADWRPATVAGGLGVEEIFSNAGRRPVYQIEVGFAEWKAGLSPVLELNFSGEQAVFAGAGLVWRAEGERWPLGLKAGVAPGYYEHGDDKFLGGGFQIMSFIEGTWRIAEDKRAGVRLSHLSNASTRGQNPGTELLTVFFELRLRRAGG